MKTWTVHARAGRMPVLVKEGFSLWAALFGPFWLLAQRAWIAGVLLLCLDLGSTLLLPDRYGTIVSLGLAWAMGVFGRDIIRWSLARRGYVLADVVAATAEDLAFGRILTARPALIDGLAL